MSISQLLHLPAKATGGRRKMKSTERRRIRPDARRDSSVMSIAMRLSDVSEVLGLGVVRVELRCGRVIGMKLYSCPSKHEAWSRFAAVASKHQANTSPEIGGSAATPGHVSAFQSTKFHVDLILY